MFQWESSVRGKSVFTRENLLAMRDVEAIALARYEDFCQIEYDELGIARGCVPYLSPLTYFFDQDGTMVDDVDAVVRDVFATNLSAFGYFLGDFDSDRGDCRNHARQVSRWDTVSWIREFE